MYMQNKFDSRNSSIITWISTINHGKQLKLVDKEFVGDYVPYSYFLFSEFFMKNIIPTSI